jgi:peptide subunit release factor 1 (eRF1)
MLLDNLMNKLTAFEPSGHPFLSLYLNAQPNERGRETYDVFVRKELSNRRKAFAEGSKELDSFERDAERIKRYLQDVPASADGIAIFACSGADFFETAELDMPIDNNRLFIFDGPHIYLLARLVDQHPRYAVLLADTNSARIFVFDNAKMLDETEIQNVKTKRTQVGGWSQMRFQRHTENYHLHHAKEIVDELEKIVREEKIEQVILAGDEAVILPLLKNEMSKALSERVIDTLRLNVNTPEHELLEATTQAVRKHDALTDADKVKRVLDSHRAGGLGVVGVAPTLAALSNGQVEELLLSANVNQLRYNRMQVGQVLEAYAPGEEDETVDTDEPHRIADELIIKAKDCSARVTFIEDASLLKDAGGVAAFLRYRI